MVFFLFVVGGATLRHFLFLICPYCFFRPEVKNQEKLLLFHLYSIQTPLPPPLFACSVFPVFKKAGKEKGEGGKGSVLFSFSDKQSVAKRGGEKNKEEEDAKGKNSVN